MKKIKYLIGGLILALMLMSVDSIYDKAVVIRDTDSKWLVHAAVTIDSIGSGDIHYTQAFQVPASAYIYCRGIASEVGTEDFNLFFEYTDDPEETWVTGTTNSAFDALGTTAVIDTVNVIAGTTDLLSELYHWMRIKIVNGQAITASGTVTLDIGGKKVFQDESITGGKNTQD